MKHATLTAQELKELEREALSRLKSPGGVGDEPVALNPAGLLRLIAMARATTKPKASARQLRTSVTDADIAPDDLPEVPAGHELGVDLHDIPPFDELLAKMIFRPVLTEVSSEGYPHPKLEGAVEIAGKVIRAFKLSDGRVRFAVGDLRALFETAEVLE